MTPSCRLKLSISRMTRDPRTTGWSESQSEDLSTAVESTHPDHSTYGCEQPPLAADLADLMLPLMEVCVRKCVWSVCLWDAAALWLRNWPELIRHGLGQHTQAHMTANKQPTRELKWTTSRAQTEDCAQVRGGLHHWRWRFPRVEGLPGSSQGSGPAV